MADDPVAVLRRARQDAINITDKVSGRALYKILKSAEEDLSSRLATHRKMRPVGDGSFTRTQMEVTLHQIRAVMRTVIDKLGIVIPDAAVGASEEASSGVVDYLRASEEAFTGINQPLALDEAVMSDAAVAGTKASVVRRLMVEHPDGKGGGILQRYGYAVAEKFEKELQVAVVTRKPFTEVRDAFVNASPFLQKAPAHWAERIARTELFGAYARGAHASMKEANEQLGGDMIRILVATFDAVTGADSYNVHGEIRRMEEPFEYVTSDGERVQFMTPPNRPNDREVVVAHRLSWPIPESFHPKSDGEVEARYRKQKAKYHGRPHKMSTVNLPTPVKEKPEAAVTPSPRASSGRLDPEKHMGRPPIVEEGSRFSAKEVMGGIKHPGLAAWLTESVNQPLLSVQKKWDGQGRARGMYHPSTGRIHVDPAAQPEYIEKTPKWGEAWTVADRLVVKAREKVPAQLRKPGEETPRDAAERKELVQGVFVHELGHHIAMNGRARFFAVDKEIVEPAYARLSLKPGGPPLDTFEKKDIESGKIRSPAISRYAVRNCDEYFAESFHAYMADPKALMRHDQNGYDMVKQTLHRMKIEKPEPLPGPKAEWE